MVRFQDPPSPEQQQQQKQQLGGSNFSLHRPVEAGGGYKKRINVGTFHQKIPDKPKDREAEREREDRAARRRR